MKTLKKINLKVLKETLNENELKNIVGGYNTVGCTHGTLDCDQRSSCYNNNGFGYCEYLNLSGGGCDCVAEYRP
jgi:natural product precursor